MAKSNPEKPNSRKPGSEELALESLVPHRRPMLLPDRLIDGDSTRARTRVTISRDCPLLDPERGLPSWALLEFFAQTAAVIGGMKARETGEPVKQGFLLGTRKLACPVSHIPVGTTLVLSAETGFVDDNGMGAYHCATDFNGHPISCTLTVFTPPPEETR